MSYEDDPMAEPSGLCIDCDKPAVAERFAGFSEETFDVDDDGDTIAEIVELVCYECALASL